MTVRESGTHGFGGGRGLAGAQDRRNSTAAAAQLVVCRGDLHHVVSVPLRVHGLGNGELGAGIANDLVAVQLRAAA